MESNVANNHSMSPIPLFLRFLCLKSDGSLLQPEEVRRNCAKLRYLMKQQVQYMKQLQPLVLGNANPFSVFTFICSTSSMARKVAASSKWLLIIARLDNPLHIVISGVGITADQVRAVYHEALYRCQTLAT